MTEQSSSNSPEYSLEYAAGESLKRSNEATAHLKPVAPAWGWVDQFWVDGDEADTCPLPGRNTFCDTASDKVRSAALDGVDACGNTRASTLGSVVVFVDFDGDHHEVHVDAFQGLGQVGAIRQAIHELERVATKLEQFAAI